jgi:hypothetical protein
VRPLLRALAGDVVLTDRAEPAGLTAGERFVAAAAGGRAGAAWSSPARVARALLSHRRAAERRRDAAAGRPLRRQLRL